MLRRIHRAGAGRYNIKICLIFMLFIARYLPLGLFFTKSTPEGNGLVLFFVVVLVLFLKIKVLLKNKLYLFPAAQAREMG